MAQDDYTPVSCDYHDVLEAAATKKRRVTLEFEQNGERQSERGVVTDVYTDSGEEFISFAADNGEVTIRLDRIFSVRELPDSGGDSRTIEPETFEGSS